LFESSRSSGDFEPAFRELLGSRAPLSSSTILRLFWRRFVAALRAVGYDHVVSVEHEDPLATVGDGLARAVAVLRQAIPAR
jgi:sugar phosphate isomerase/epimerase